MMLKKRVLKKKQQKARSECCDAGIHARAENTLRNGILYHSAP